MWYTSPQGTSVKFGALICVTESLIDVLLSYVFSEGALKVNKPGGTAEVVLLPVSHARPRRRQCCTGGSGLWTVKFCGAWVLSGINALATCATTASFSLFMDCFYNKITPSYWLGRLVETGSHKQELSTCSLIINNLKILLGQQHQVLGDAPRRQRYKYERPPDWYWSTTAHISQSLKRHWWIGSKKAYSLASSLLIVIRWWQFCF